MDNDIVIDKDYCMSSFLLYRRVVDSNKAFSKYGKPLMNAKIVSSVPIKTSSDLENHLRSEIKSATKDGRALLALSGGIDSAILAKMMPENSSAVTFKCTAGNSPTVDESERAAFYAKECNLKHEIIEITWNDMEEKAPILMKHKKAPIHSIEVQIYMAAIYAKEHGFDRVIYGETADVKYGGLSNILSKEWTVGGFIERYAYLKPWYVLKNPIVDFSCILPYCREDGTVDVHKYLSEFDIIESVNSYTNACDTAGVEFFSPYLSSFLDTDLDIERVRRGENKYIIREIFNRLYDGVNPPDKIPMPRATEQWLKEWAGPCRNEFLPNCVHQLDGDEKWLLWTLEQFLNICDKN